MSAITATEARKGFFRLIRQVNHDHIAIEVVSRHGNAIIISKADYDAMTETAYLLRNPANAERLLAAIGRARRNTTGWADELRAAKELDNDPIIDPWDNAGQEDELGV